MPWAKIAYELNHDLRALETIKTAADTLLSRYSNKLGCIRSWDKCVTKKYDFQDMDTDFMVIIVGSIFDGGFLTASDKSPTRII